MIHGVKRELSRPIWTHLKKHYCPDCQGFLTAVKVSKFINSKSEEARDFDFSTGDGDLVGNIKFIWTAFHCRACSNTYSANEIRKAEKRSK